MSKEISGAQSGFLSPRGVAAAQAAYYLLTGVWPFIHLRSFLAVTGEKYDIWLVETVSVLVIAIGTAIATAAFRNRVSTEIVVLAITSAVGLVSIELIYVAKQRIAATYLIDVVVHLLLLLAWTIALVRRTHGRILEIRSLFLRRVAHRSGRRRSHLDPIGRYKTAQQRSQRQFDRFPLAGA